VQNGPIILEHDPETFSDFTPRVALRYEITPGQSVYASYSQGFKSGLIARTQTEPVKPEEVVAYEVGYKLGRDNIRLDLAAFWYDYTNLQATAFRSGVNSAQIFNAADATIKGLEGTLYFSPVDVIGFNANATYLDAKYDNFPNAISQIPKPDLTGSTLVSPVDVSGNKIIRTPEFSANVGVDLHPPVSSGNLTLSMSYSYSSRVYWGFDNANSQKPWGLLNASVNWTSDDERYSVTLFGTNITDEKYFSGVVESAAINWANYGNPAVFGVKLGTKW
jgi:iron complex outermembrane receptor protein